MLLAYNTSTDDNISVSECLSADEVSDYRKLWDDDFLPEALQGIKPVPGIVFTMASVESLPKGECHYDVIYYFCNSKVAKECIDDLYSSNKTKLLEKDTITLLNPDTDAIQLAIIAMQEKL